MASPSSSAAAPAGAPITFPEENGIVLDKWLIDVCGEDDLQFPSHRRAQYPAYTDRLRRVSRMKQFIANTFDYPSRSGTREVLVLQKTLEALGVEEQQVKRQVRQVQETTEQVRRVLEERTMGASTIVEEEKAHAARLAEMQVEQQATTTPQQQQQQQAPRTPQAQAASPSATAPRFQGYGALNTVIPTVATATTSTPTRAGQPPQPQPARDASLRMADVDHEDLSMAESRVNSRAGAATSDEPQSFSAVARAARRADYEKKKALSQRYMAEMQSKTQAMAAQRAEAEQRQARLLKDKEQLDKEYEALQTTEALVVARHEEAASHQHEEAMELTADAAAYAQEDAAFATVYDLSDAEAGVTTAPAIHVDPAAASYNVATLFSNPPPQQPQHLMDPSRSLSSSYSMTSAQRTPPSPPVVQNATAKPGDTSAVGASSPGPAAASPSPGVVRDKSTDDATLHTHRPGSHLSGSENAFPSSSSSSSSSAATSETTPPVERALDTSDVQGEEDGPEREQRPNTAPGSAILVPLSASENNSVHGAAAAAAAAAASQNAAAARRTLLEELRRKLTELAASSQACRRQLVNASQIHMGRFRQAQQRLKDWQDMAEQLRLTHLQLRGQCEVIRTLLEDAVARLDKSNAAAHGGYGNAYAHQLAKLNSLLKERSYETLQYYMGSGEEAAVDMLYDANAEEELRTLHRPSPSAAAGGMTPIRGVNSTSASSVAASVASSRQGSVGNALNGSSTSAYSAGAAGPQLTGAVDAPHRHRSRYELVRHLQRWEATLLAERLAILKAAHMEPGPYSGAGENKRLNADFQPVRCYQELRKLLIQPKSASEQGGAANRYKSPLNEKLSPTRPGAH